MRVLSLNPPFLKNYSRQSRSPCVAKSGTIYYSYYLAYAGCAAELANCEVNHIDAIAFELSFDDVLEKARQYQPSLILVDTSTPSIWSDIEFASRLKKSIPSAVVLCVGTFPSKNIKEFYRLVNSFETKIDGCLLGEYEETVYEICTAITSGEDWQCINGTSSIDVTGKIIGSDQPRKTSAEFLDRLPFVSDFYLRHLGEPGIKRHFYASIKWPYIQILTARGCPFKCSFCNIPSIGSYRVRSIDSVIDELKFIVENMSFVKEIFIEDDTFPINKKRTIEICKRIIDENIKIKWSCNARVDTDKETLEIMRKAGCRLTCVGFESPSVDALIGTIKKTNLAQQEQFMESANNVGIKVNGCFIIGLHGDNRKSIQKTIDYSKKLMPNTAQFYPHMVYPGTGSFQWALENNLLEHTDWSKWNTEEGFHSTPLRINGISSAELLILADDARKQFYTNPRYLLKMLWQSIKSPTEFQRMLIAGKSFFPILISYVFKRNYGLRD